jgi:hypothetical protein
LFEINEVFFNLNKVKLLILINLEMYTQKLLEKRDKSKILSHMGNVLAVMLADGEIDENENVFFNSLGIRSGFSQDEIDTIKENPEKIEFTPPETFEEKVEQLYDLVLVTMADGKIMDSEVQFCKFIANKFGLKNNIIDSFIVDMTTMIQEGEELASVLQKMEKYE